MTTTGPEPEANHPEPPEPPAPARQHVIGPGELPGQAAALLGDGFRLALAAGMAGPGPAGTAGLRAVYLFTQAGTGRRTELHVPLDPARPRVPSLAALSFPAGRFEREMRDLYGIEPEGHPLPRRLVRHHHWPKGWYPMADGGPPPDAFGDTDGPYPFRTVEGPGVYEIPVGPVHAGMIGPGHFRFSVVGETILNLKARLWFTHRGVERQFQGRPPEDGAALAARVSGDTTAGHTLAFCLAVEDALGIAVPEREQRIRAVVLELERLYNHAADLGALCNDVGHSILNAHASRVRERLLRLNDAVTGHRLLRGAIYPGGAVLRAWPDPAGLAAAEADLAEIADLALGHAVVRDRFTGTAVLPKAAAEHLGTLGYVARASGVATDARRDHPLPGVPFPPIRYSRADGDVLARFLARSEEIAPSVKFIQDSAERIDGYRGTPPGALPVLSAPAPPVVRPGTGIAEGWRGTIVHRVELAADGTLARVKIADPSFFNWPALPVAMNGTIVPDFPLANKSFNLSYAGNDL